MKIRNGFVSNSSTSSFVLIGWKIESKYELLKDLFPQYVKNDLDDDEVHDYLMDQIWSDGNCLSDDRNIFYGKIIADISSDGDDYDEQELDFEQLKKDVEDLPRNLKEKLGPPKLITGVRAS